MTRRKPLPCCVASGVDPFVTWMMAFSTGEGMSQTALAHKVGVSAFTVGRWSTGAVTPSLHNARAAANALGYDLVLHKRPSRPKDSTKRPGPTHVGNSESTEIKR